MDCLLANYASSDGEENDEQIPRLQLKSPTKSVKLESEAEENFFSKSTTKSGGVLSSLPPPKSQSFTNPKSQSKFGRGEQILEVSKPESSSSSLFSFLPQPSKKVVQFRPPTILNTYSRSVNDEDEDEDEGEKEREGKKLKETVPASSSVMSFLSRMPTPMHSSTLGALHSASGTSRKSMLETGAQVSTAITMESYTMDNSTVEDSKDQSTEKSYDYSSWSLGSESYTSNVSTTVGDSGLNSYVGASEVQSGELNYDYSSMSSGNESHASYGGYSSGHCVDDAYGNVGNVKYANYSGNYGDYNNYAHYENNLVDSSNGTALPGVSGVVENAVQFPGKRSRRDAPQHIIEVKQDELMKNRPREDQVKTTGIAFGPAYEPTSTKGKPSKLHKRKHQIGSLFFDMKQKEMEYAERRANGYLTKAQTQAKYGW